VDLRPADDHVEIAIDTPDGPTRLTADWLVACDGAKSPVRDMLGLAFDGASFEDRFLIADVRMLADFPTERWFWFDPPFHPGRSALLHRQPDDVWRIDLQLGPDADPAVERLPERVVPRLRAMLGESVPFELVWTSVYGFQCRRLQRFTHGRVMFAGDSAHQVSPFGARGANSGIQDADNLAWKLDLVLRGAAPAGLIASYDAERVPAADENIGHSTRATDFIAPVSPMAQAMRATVLEFAHDDPNFRALVNSGRLSRASSYPRSPLVTPDTDDFIGGPGPGDPPIDAPLFDADGRPTWLLDRIGHGFTLLTEAERPASADAARSLADALGIALLSFGAAGAFMDPDGVTRRRWDGRDGTVWLLRPDGHVAARSRAPTKPWLATALARACGHVT
jgi:3-(3-hydroxy-phenyl)propionate hydroxylase